MSKESTTKSVWLVRHGQSVFNEKMDSYFEKNASEKHDVEKDPYEWWERNDHYDPFTRDAELTHKGIEQAHSVGEKIKDLQFDLIVVSPLLRALRTLKGIAKARKEKVNVIVHPFACERVNSSCDVGSSISVLKKTFSDLDFSTLKEGKNWYALSGSYEGSFACVPDMAPPKRMEPLDKFSKRIDKFKSWLKSRPEKRICVVCHAVVIHEFTNTWVSNCSVTRIPL
jgi:glucosyl-3-phosphoglycerate phosphatase